MSQNRDNEVTELGVPESLPTCKSTQPPTVASLHPHLPPTRSSVESDPTDFYARLNSAGTPVKPDPGSALAEDRGSLKRSREVLRCSGSGCRKRVGLMGFRCRCGDVFCPEHRYSDRHDCSYDYKAAGREVIARENPVIRAAKLLKV